MMHEIDLVDSSPVRKRERTDASSPYMSSIKMVSKSVKFCQINQLPIVEVVNLIEDTGVLLTCCCFCNILGIMLDSPDSVQALPL